MSDAKKNAFGYSPFEEIANYSTHALGLSLSIAGLILLLISAIQKGDLVMLISFIIYGVSLVILYFASTMYHLMKEHRAKKIFRTLDHCGIYLLIAGTYTPIMLVSLGTTLGWGLLGTIWALALIGIVLTLSNWKINRKIFVALYIIMGWLAVTAFQPMVNSLPYNAMAWLITGGGLYTFGVVFYLLKSLSFHHAIWHVFVMGGSISHFITIYFYVN